MSIAPNATEERPQALGRVFRHEFARALAYLRLGAIPAYIVAYFGIRRVFRVTAAPVRDQAPGSQERQAASAGAAETQWETETRRPSVTSPQS